jgi:exopolysaccharide biosynthesis polyprenyl glycosylphosphotransferase
VILFAAEAAVVAAAARAGWAVGDAPPGGTVVTVVACALALQLAFYWADLYDVRVAAEDARTGRRLMGALGTTFALAAPVSLLASPPVRAAMPFALGAAAVAAAGLRAIAPMAPLRRRVLIVGTGRTRELVLRELAAGEDIIAGVRDTVPANLAEDARLLGASVVVTAFDEPHSGTGPILLACRLAGIEIMAALTYIEESRRKVPVQLVTAGAWIYGDGFRRTRLHDVGHRAVSILGATILLVLLSPLFAVVLAAIKIDSPGPVFYRQTRVGRNGRRFRMWKLRTMFVDAEARTGAVWARRDDPRVTRVGRFLRRTRIDELPQLINVLGGDMDLVGPRPERPEFVERLVERIPFYEVRTLVRPGITGWAQICYPYGASLEDAKQKLAYDLYYVKRASLLLDLIVLFHTAKVVVLGRGAR